MEIKVWTTKVNGKTVYHVFFDGFESLPKDAVEVRGNRFVPSESLMFETDDIKVLLSKINKTIEKEVKYLIKDGN